jgi:hypothetical protein
VTPVPIGGSVGPRTDLNDVENKIPHDQQIIFTKFSKFKITFKAQFGHSQIKMWAFTLLNHKIQLLKLNLKLFKIISPTLMNAGDIKTQMKLRKVYTLNQTNVTSGISFTPQTERLYSQFLVNWSWEWNFCHN